MFDQQILTLVAIATVAGMAIPAGALLASVDRIQPHWLEQEIRHGVIALGAGALISAVALVLVPEGVKHHSPVTATLCFAGGAIAFMVLDIYLAAHDSPASQLAAMLSDFIPESIAMGTAAALGGGGTMLLGLLIAVQNLPEGFNAYREMESAGPKRPKHLKLKFTMLALLGPLMALVGYYWLSGYPMWTGGIMLFAAGGILYSVFQDIGPQIPMNKRWLPPMGGIVGFLIGMVGFMMEGGA